MPRYSCPVTYVLQLEFILPEELKSCIDVSMSVVNHRTKRIKEQIKMIPGINIRLAARIRITRRKIKVSEAVTMPNGKSLRPVSYHVLPKCS